MNSVNKNVGKKMKQIKAGIVSLMILATITSLSGVAMNFPDAAYAADSHKQRCLSIGGDGGDAGYGGDYNRGGGGGGGNGGEGGIGGKVNGGDGGNGGKGLGGNGGDGGGNGGDGGDGGKSRLACIIVDPDLTIKPTLVVPSEAFEPRDHR
jgi:hypothetical protein